MTAITRIKSAEYNYNWSFTDGMSFGHVWGIAIPDTPNKPYLTYDPRARSFGLNRRCSSCYGMIGSLSGLIYTDRIADPDTGAETPFSEFSEDR